MSLEGNIDKLLAKPLKMPMWKAKQISEALRRDDYDELERLSWDGYVEHIPEPGDPDGPRYWVLTPRWAEAYHAAWSKAGRSQSRKNAQSRARGRTLSGLGMRRSRSGSWE